jgi:hypothetical protein
VCESSVPTCCRLDFLFRAEFAMHRSLSAAIPARSMVISHMLLSSLQQLTRLTHVNVAWLLDLYNHAAHAVSCVPLPRASPGLAHLNLQGVSVCETVMNELAEALIACTALTRLHLPGHRRKLTIPVMRSLASVPSLRHLRTGPDVVFSSGQNMQSAEYASCLACLQQLHTLERRKQLLRLGSRHATAVAMHRGSHSTALPALAPLAKSLGHAS